MALIQNGLHKVQVGVGTLALRAEADTSLRVVRIRECGPCDVARYIELTINRKSVGHFRCAYPDANFFSASDIQMNQYLSAYDELAMWRRNAVNIFDWMTAYGVPFTYPVGEGETFRIDVIANQTVDVEYDLYDAADVLPTEINGIESNEFLYIERGTNAAAVLIGAVDTHLTQSITPAQFPDFPFGGVAGAKSTFEIYGIIGQPASVGDAVAQNGTTERLQLIKDREILLDPDRNGLMFLGDVTSILAFFVNTRVCSVIGHHLNPNDRPLMFNPPLVFEPGSELNVIITFVAAVAATNIAAASFDVGFIMKETRG